MVDDEYDRLYEKCEDYWYWNARIALAGSDIHGYADSRVEIRYGDPLQTQVREVHASNGLSAQGDARLLFGLGDYEGEVQLRINWCGGRRQMMSVASGQYVRIDSP